MSDASLDLNKSTVGFEKCQQLLGNMQNLAKSRMAFSSSNVGKSNGLLDAFKQNQHQKLRNLSQFLGLPISIPEQTEPEDLSFHSPRSRASGEEFDDLEDAAAMYLKSYQDDAKTLSILNNIQKSKSAQYEN